MEIAQEVLKDKGQGNSFPTSLRKLMKGESLDLETIETTKPFEGRFELDGNQPVIFLNLHGRGLGDPRVRFTLAHELGHFFLHRGRLRDGSSTSFHDRTIEYGNDLKNIEQEANDFASECLLPSPLVETRLKRNVLRIEVVGDIANEANTSLQATAIKIASLTTSRSCFFWEEDGVIRWAAPSDDWKHSKFKWSRWRGESPPESEISKNFEGFSEQEVDFNVWCPNSRERDEPLFESAFKTSYGRLVFVVDPNTDGYFG